MKKLILILVCIGLLSLPVLSMAATEAEKFTAIANGLAYLNSVQNPDGSFPGASGYPIAATASALLAFEEEYYKLGNSWGSLNGGLGYSNVVTKATNYLLGQTQAMSLAAPNWWGFTGSYPDKTGLYWALGFNSEEVYQTGLVVPALSRLTNGINGISSGTVISSPNPNVNGKTYGEVIQRTVDLFAWGQNGPANGFADGGWRYVVPSPNDADGSTSQWPAIAFLFAKNAGATVPTQTTNEIIKWINYIQNPVSGGVGYQANNSLVDESKTGGILVSMFLAGGGGSMANALSFLNANWKNFANNTWYGNFGQPYAMWSIYKGLEVAIGLDNMTAITNLNANPGDVDNPNHGWNWWEDYCNWLVLNQNGNGSWSGYSYWDFGLATPWDINILNGTLIAPPPPGGEVPEPATMILLGSGLVGLAGYARKRMKK